MDVLKDLKSMYSEADVGNFVSESDFMNAYVELHKQTIRLLYLIVEEKYKDKNGDFLILKRNDAIIGGNLIRLIKFNTSFLQNICDKKLEICYVLNRLVTETAINIIYLLKKNTDSIFNKYVKYSLITERRLQKVIDENISLKNGNILDIERRMTTSINNAFNNSEYDIDDVNNSSNWKPLSKRAEEIGLSDWYNISYGISSHSIHGNWQDILTNNLKEVDGGFVLDDKWTNTRPQIIDSSILFNIKVTEAFILKNLISDTYQSKIDILLKYQKVLINGHEKLLRNK